MQNSMNGMVVFAISLSIYKKLRFHPEIKVMLVHTACLSPLSTRTLRTPLRSAQLVFWLFLWCWLIATVMSITTVAVNLAWRIETSSFQNAKITTSSSLSLIWKQVQSYLVDLSQIHNYQSDGIIFLWINYSLKNHLLGSNLPPRNGISPKVLPVKSGCVSDT